MPESTRDNQSERKLFWSSVAASVVASVIVIALIHPLLSSTWNFLSSTGSELLAGFVDRLYRNAALGNRNWVIALFALALLYVPFANVIVLAVTRPLFRKLFASTGPDGKHRSPVVILTTLIATTAFGMVLATVPASYIYADLQLNASFDQRLNALAPHLSDQQIKELKASWAMMTSKADYLKIREKMDVLADQANIKIPDPLLRD